MRDVQKVLKIARDLSEHTSQIVEVVGHGFYSSVFSIDGHVRVLCRTDTGFGTYREHDELLIRSRKTKSLTFVSETSPLAGAWVSLLWKHYR